MTEGGEMKNAWMAGLIAALLLGASGLRAEDKEGRKDAQEAEEEGWDKPDWGPEGPQGGWGREGGKRRPGKGPSRGMGRAVEERIQGCLKESAPDVLKEIEGLGPQHLRKFRMQAHRFGPVCEDPELRKIFVRGLRSELDVRRAAKKLKDAKGEEKDKLKKDMEKALSEQFDAKLEGHQVRLKKTQEEIEKLKARIEKRRSMKSQLVQKRLGELSGDTETWDW